MSTYEELLNRQEWKSFRETILQRDRFQCLNCHNENFLKDKSPCFVLRISGFELKPCKGGYKGMGVAKDPQGEIGIPVVFYHGDLIDREFFCLLD
jgi:hypothetical protein